METINGLLRELDNKVPVSISKRLDGFKRINQKLSVVREEHNENPTEESQEKIDEIIDFISDTQDDLIQDLSVLVQNKRKAEDLKSRQIAQRRQQIEADKLAERRAIEARRKKELEQKELLEKETSEIEPIITKEPEKKSGFGWGGLLVGGALLILSAGAINYFKKQ